VLIQQLRGDVSFRVRSGLRARGLGPELVVGPVVLGVITATFNA